MKTEFTEFFTGEKVLLEVGESLTKDNVVEELEKYISDITKDIPQGEKYPINQEIISSFAHFMDFAIFKTNLSIIKEVHETIISYLVNYYSIS